MKTTLEVLRDAKGYIIRYGWCQGYEVNDLGQACAMGALDRVCGDPYSTLKAADLLAAHLQKDWRRNTQSSSDIVDYNDARGRTKRQILGLFDQAIHTAEALEANRRKE
jgi:hypothetical protein